MDDKKLKAAKLFSAYDTYLDNNLEVSIYFQGYFFEGFVIKDFEQYQSPEFEQYHLGQAYMICFKKLSIDEMIRRVIVPHKQLFPVLYNDTMENNRILFCLLDKNLFVKDRRTDFGQLVNKRNYPNDENVEIQFFVKATIKTEEKTSVTKAFGRTVGSSTEQEIQTDYLQFVPKTEPGDNIILKHCEKISNTVKYDNASKLYKQYNSSGAGLYQEYLEGPKKPNTTTPSIAGTNNETNKKEIAGGKKKKNTHRKSYKQNSNLNRRSNKNRYRKKYKKSKKYRR
jgi:hypothetical protein